MAGVGKDNEAKISRRIMQVLWKRWKPIQNTTMAGVRKDNEAEISRRIMQVLWKRWKPIQNTTIADLATISELNSNPRRRKSKNPGTNLQSIWRRFSESLVHLGDQWTIIIDDKNVAILNRMKISREANSQMRLQQRWIQIPGRINPAWGLPKWSIMFAKLLPQLGGPES